MKRFSLAGALVFLGAALMGAVIGPALFSGCNGNYAFAQQPAPPAKAAHYRHHGAAPLPDPHATPGAIDAELTKGRLCDPSFHTVTARAVTDSQFLAAGK